MSDGIIRSRHLNSQKIDLKWSRSRDRLPFDKHRTTGSFMRTRDITRHRLGGIRLRTTPELTEKL